MVNFFIRALLSEFRVKEPVLDAFFLFNICRLILVGVGRGGGVVDGGF